MITLTKENFAQEVLQSDKPVLVDFWATWCGPCRMMAPVIEELDAEHPEYKFGKVNVDEQPELAGEYRIMSIPTLMVFRGGQAAAVKVGATPKEELLNLLVEGSTANDNLIELATERIYNLLANLLENLLVYEWHVEQQTHAIGLKLRQHLFADNLLDNQRYSNDDCRFYFCKGCSDDSRRRNACKVEHVTAEEEFEEEFERHAIHVRHRENTDDIIALLNVLGYGSHSKVVVAPHCAVRNHNTLRETGSARSVIDKR